MKLKTMLATIFLTTIFLSSVNAQIIEAKQLFNKKTTKVKEEKFSFSKEFYGNTTLDESLVVDIVSRFDGFVTNLNANKTYMDVKKNQALFSIYSDDILSIQNEMQIAKNFNKNIYNSSLMKLKALDINKNEIEKIKKGQISSNGVLVTSPVNGIVLKKNINNSSAVKKGTLLLQIANLEKLWFIASIYQADLSFIKKDMEALVFIDGVKQPIKSKLDYIYPTVDSKTKTVDVRFIIENKEMKHYSNMFGKVKIKEEAKSILTLPKTSVLTKGNKYYVFKPISKDEFEPIKIEAKRIASNKYEILDGLKVGDEVINNALFLLDSDAITNALYESDDEDW